MTATNHALTGAVIGLATGNPYIALPAAVASHFICDALPHFGAGPQVIDRSWFRYVLIAEAILCALIVGVLILFRPQHWLLASLCAFLAASPDFMWIPKFLRAQRELRPVARQPIALRFHAWIQWFERPVGAVLEIAWAAAAIILLKVFIV